MPNAVQPGAGVPPAPLTDRVNSEPPIVNGMSATEASYVGAAAFVVSLLLGVLLYALTGYWYFIFGISIIGPLAALWYASLYLQQVKRNKPEGWYVQAARLWLTGVGFGRGAYLRHDGFFDLGRRLDFEPVRHPGPTSDGASGPRNVSNAPHEQP